MIDKFVDVLDRDETIIKIYKPNKKRMVNIQLIFSIAFIFLFTALMLTFSILGYTSVITVMEEGVDTTLSMANTLLIFSILGFLAMALIVVYTFVRYNKTFYAYSNKRILIRTGFIGVDFAVLDMNLIGVVAINVGLLDKFVKPNTGTIRFGSNSTPINSQQSNKGIGGLTFSHIDDAYVTYREIKEVIDQAKKDK